MGDKDFREIVLGNVVCIGLIASMGLAGCEQQPSMEVKEQASAPKVEAPPAEEAKTEEAKMEAPMEASMAETSAFLEAPESSAGRAENEEGVSHAQQGHWESAEGHFRKALETDPKLAEAHFNLGLALDALDRHDEANAAFEKAVELAPNNSMITESPVFKKHMST